MRSLPACDALLMIAWQRELINWQQLATEHGCYSDYKMHCVPTQDDVC